MEPYPWGDDVEWVAVDGDGRVAVFTSGGDGPVPRAFLHARDTLARVNGAIWSLPEISESELLVTLPSADDYTAFARRGLFAYDWADTHRTSRYSNKYELYARPLTPVRFLDLGWPTELRQLIAAVTTPALDFSHPSIDVRDLDCISGDSAWHR